MKPLTNKQSEIAIALRQLLKEARPEEAGDWEHYIDFTRALACMLDGLDVLISPQDMKSVFQQGLKTYFQIWAATNRRIVLQSLGDEMLWENVQRHRNGRTVVERILTRVKEQHGSLRSGLTTTVEVADILHEEMPDLDIDCR